MFWKRISEVSLLIDKEKCDGCGICAAKCKQQALIMHYRDDKGFAKLLYPERCTGCGKCAVICKNRAIEIEPVYESGVLVEQMS